MARTLRAKFIAPMSSPMIADGGVVVSEDGRIADAGPFSLVRDGDVEDLGEVVLLPGLVNAHTHLELSGARVADARPTSFGAWVLDIVRRQSRIVTEEEAAADTLAGAAESLSFGVTSVGDITRWPAVTRSALRGSPLRVVSFGEVRAMARRRENLRPHIEAAVDPANATDRLTRGLSPHAPYSVEPDGYRACVEAARRHGLPICTHLAESPDEVAFLSRHAGPLREVWEALANWSYDVPKWTRSPVAFAKEVGVLDVSPLLAHVNYADDADLDMLAASRAGIVFCPRTHAYFGHPPHRWREMLARGINVCVGTDSRASSPDLNVVDDLRLLHRQSPEVAPGELWEMVSTRAATALGMPHVGALRPRMAADLVAFPVRTEDPLREMLEGRTLPTRCWIGGQTVRLR